LRDRVIRIFREVMDIDSGAVREDLTPDDIENWDSLRHMNMVLALEEEFEIELDDSRVMMMDSLGTIIEIIKDLGH